MGDEGDHYEKNRAEAWNTLLKVTVARGVREYFQIDCCMRVSTSIFKWLSHAGVPEYFQIEGTEGEEDEADGVDEGSQGVWKGVSRGFNDI